MPTPATTAPTAATPLLAEVRHLIDAARQRVASAVNAELTQLYWHIGRRISAELLQGQRGTYGQQVVAELARQLTADFGKGWSERQLHYCVRVAEVFPDAGILHTLCSQLSWSHLRLVIQIEDPLKRDFYLEICRVERWSVRQLQERINSLLVARTARLCAQLLADRRHAQACGSRKMNETSEMLVSMGRVALSKLPQLTANPGYF